MVTLPPPSLSIRLSGRSPGIHRPGFFYKRSMSRVTSRLRFIEPQLASCVACVGLGGAALFVSRPSKVPFIENNISLIEFAREKVA
jgi:hypothetical protein